MKKLLVVIVVLAVVAGGALFALPRLVPMERIEKEVTSRFTAATGRQLSYGAVRVTVWPNLGLRLNDVKVSNPDWAKDKSMLTLGQMDVSLSARALLQKKVDVQKFILKQPVIALEKAADGRTSWTLKPDAEVKAAVDAPANAPAQSKTAADYDVSLGEISISDGQITYRDDATGKVETVGNVDINISMPNLQAALNVDGGLDFRGKRVTLALSLDRPFDLVNGKTSPGSVTLKSDVLNADVAGDLSTANTLLKGRVSADISSLPGLIAWLSQQPQKDAPIKKVSVAATAEASANAISLTGTTLTADDMKGTGDIKVDLAGARPALRARLALDHVNLDRFIAAGGEKGEGTDKAAPAANASGWDATPIDLSALKAADADVVVQTKGFTVKGVEVGASTLTAKLANGNLAFSSTDAAIFGGTAGSSLTVNASSAVPAITAKFNLAGVDAKPVLSTFAGFDKLSGKADGNISVATSGNSQRAMIGNLSGEGRALFRNGAIEGIDIVNLAKAIQSKLGEMGVGAGKTEFVDLGGTFTIKSGIVHNDDLKLRGPLVQATGSGDVNLPSKSMKYRVVPVLTASSAVEGASGIKVPVDIVGPFSDLKIRPDYAAVLQDALQNPQQIKDTLKNAKESVAPLKANIKDLRQDIKKDPAKAIEGLLGGGLGGLMAPKAQPAPAEAAPAPAAAETTPATPEAAPAATTP